MAQLGAHLSTFSRIFWMKPFFMNVEQLAPWWILERMSNSGQFIVHLSKCPFYQYLLFNHRPGKVTCTSILRSREIKQQRSFLGNQIENHLITSKDTPAGHYLRHTGLTDYNVHLPWGQHAHFSLWSARNNFQPTRVLVQENRNGWRHWFIFV